MPPNYQNSLGWLDLQLRSQREKDLQEQAFKREGMAREDRQLETQNSLALGKQAAQAMGDAENRKLQLADMMARARLQEEGKAALQEDKQAFEQPKVDAMVKKALADAGYAEARTKETPLEGESKRRWRSDSIATTRRGQKLGFLGGLLRAGATADSFGRRTITPGQETLDQAGETLDEALPSDNPDLPALTAPHVDGLGQSLPPEANPVSFFDQMRPQPAAAPATPSHRPVAVLAPPSDPNVQPLKPEALSKIAVENKDLQGSVDRQEKLYEKASKFPGSYFGLEGSALGLNTAKDFVGKVQTLAGKKGTKIQKDSANRAEFNSEMGLEMAQTVRDFSGASSAEQEHSRLAGTGGITKKDLELIGKGEKDPFSLDQPVFLKVFRAAIDWKKSKAATNQQVLRDQGVRIDGAPSASSAPQISPGEILKQAAADPVVKQKLMAAKASLPKGLTPEQEEAALAALARRLLPQQANP